MRNKKILVIIIILISILILVGGSIAILYFTTDIFISKDKLFLKYISQNSKILDIVENENIEKQKNLQEYSSYITNGNLNISMRTGAQLNTQTINAVTTSRYDINTGRTYSDFTLKNGGADLIKASYINSNDVYSIKIHDVLNSYIGVKNSELKQFAKNLGADDEIIAQIPNSINLEEMFAQYKITEQEKNYMMQTYSEIIINKINIENYSKLDKSIITVSEQNYECNGYVLNLTGEEIKEIIINCLNKMKEDEVILSILRRIIPSEAQINIAELINENIVEMQEDEWEWNLKITVYENNKKLLRTEVEIEEEFKITINLLENTEEQKVNIILEEYTSSYLADVNTNQIQIDQDTSAAEINFTKKMQNNGITNSIEFVPDTNTTDLKIVLSKTIGEAQNNTIQNSAITTIIVPDGQMVQSTYDKTIMLSTQIEEIPESNDSNSVIFNNYTIEQLTPFIEQLSSVLEERVINKVQELNINDETNLVPAILTSGISVINTNVIDLENFTPIVAGGVIGAGMIVYNYSATDILDSTQTQISTMENEAINAQFEKYKGEQSGSAVKMLCDNVNMHNLSNANNISNQIAIVMNSASQITSEPIVEVTSERIEQIKSQILTEKVYVIDFGYSFDGKIIAIGIVEK